MRSTAVVLRLCADKPSADATDKLMWNRIFCLCRPENLPARAQTRIPFDSAENDFLSADIRQLWPVPIYREIMS